MVFEEFCTYLTESLVSLCFPLATIEAEPKVSEQEDGSFLKRLESDRAGWREKKSGSGEREQRYEAWSSFERLV